MKVIDGSTGEGGGQIFRSSLSLAMCRGEAIRVENIRAGRKKPGLLRQHLCCLRAAEEISAAEVKGGELGSTCVEFIPRTIKSGCFRFSVGSAGSSTLVFQTILPALLMAQSESRVMLEGGTHNGMAPSFDFINRAFLPQAEKMGCDVDVKINRYGFFPAGGGKWSAKISPWNERLPLKVNARGEEINCSATVTSARLPDKLIERELHTVKAKLGWRQQQLFHRRVESLGPGNILSLCADYAHVSEIIEVVGEKKLDADRTATKATKMFKHYSQSTAPVGEYLADQLLVPMVLGAGGSFVCTCLSLHSITNIELINDLLGERITVNSRADDWHEVTVRGIGNI